MPNHVTNRVVITAPSIFDEWLCLRAVTDADGHFDLGKLIPMPESLNVEASWRDVDIAAARSSEPPDNPDNVALMRSNLFEHGYAYWYDFAIANWGTKSNAYSHANEPGEVVDSDASRVLADSLLAQGHPYAEDFALEVHRGELRRPGVLVFDTAWDCPRPVYAEVAKRFPSVRLVVEYADESIGHRCGTLVYEGGELVADTQPSEAEAIAFACRVTGYDPEDDE